MMPARTEIQEEIQRLEEQLKAITVSGKPVEGYESDYERLSQQLAALKEQLLTIEAPYFSQLIEKARQYAKAEQFAEALQALDEAKEYVGQFEERRAILKRTRDQITQQRENWSKTFAERIRQILEDTAHPLPPDIDVQIENFRHQVPDAEPEAAEWLGQITKRRREEEIARAVAELRPELQQLWEECERAIQAGEIVAAHEAARAALEKAKELERKYPGVGTVLELVKQASDWEKEARGAASTVVQTANFQKILEEYEELENRGYTELPSPRAVREAGRLKFTIDEKGQEVLVVTPDWPLVLAAQAIDELETLATEYAIQKAEEKLELARQYVERDPREAARLLEGTRSLFVPSHRTGDPRWQKIQREIAEYEQVAVQPALARREKAERRRDAALRMDVLQAWDELGEVEKLDPHVPLINEARGSLHSRLIEQVKKALQNAQSLRQRRQWERAIRVVEPFLERTRQDTRLADWTQKLEEFIARCEEGAREEASILEELNAIQSLIAREQFQEAHERLAVIEGRLGENLAAYPQAKSLRDRIDARLRLDELLHRASMVHDAPSSDDDIERMIQALEKAAEEHRARQGDIVPLLKRLQARLLFRQAEREYRQGTADFHGLRQRFQSVIDMAGADAERARRYLEEMAKTEREFEEIEHTIRVAREHLAAKRYRQAYETLHPLAMRQPPVPQHTQVWKLFEEARESLTKEIEQRLSRFQQRRRLDVRSILEKVEELRELDPVRARAWDELVARCYIQQAEEADTPANALKYWKEASYLVGPDSPLHPRIARGLKEAEKAVAFRKVDTLVGAWTHAVEILEGLQAQYPDDPEIRLRLAEVFLEGSNLPAARTQLDTANRLLGRAEETTSGGLFVRLAEIQKRLEAAERLYQEKMQIERMLKPENPLDDFTTAIRKVNGLRRRKDVPLKSIEDWWGELAERVVQELWEKYREQQERGEPLWKAGQIMLKILELQPESGAAREILAKVARQGLELLSRVEQEVHRTTGPIGVRAEDALEQQIRETCRLLEEAEVYRAIFQRRGGELTPLRPTGLDEAVMQLRAWRDRLLLLRTQIEEARGCLYTAMQTGEERDWDRCKELIQQIEGTFDRSRPGAQPSPFVFPEDRASFASHPTVRLLVEEYEKARETRQRLEGYLEEIPRAWKQEKFDRVRWLIGELRREDPDGQKYGLTNRRLRVRVLEEVDLGLDQLEGLLVQRENQLKKLETWAEAARRVVPWHPLPPQRMELLPEEAADAGPEIARILESIQRAIRSGDFRGAGTHYLALPLADETGKTEILPEMISEKVEKAIRQADFKTAWEWCPKALCGEIPRAVDEVLKSDPPNLDRALERWREVRATVEGGLTRIPGSGEYWSLLKVRDWLRSPPVEEGDETLLGRRAGLILARAMALASEVDAWIEEAEAKMEAIPETQREFSSLLQDARDTLNAAARTRNRGKRNRLLDSAQAALDEARRLCRESADLQEVQDLLNRLR